MNNPNQGGQQNQSGQHGGADQKPGQQQQGGQKPGQQGGVDTNKPGQQNK